MGWTLLATRVLLSAVFGAAGLSKLLDIKGSQKAITDFGMPPWTSAPLGIGLPVTEIAVALLLLFVKSAWMGAVVALALLLTFSTAIAINIWLGRRPECHCFGQVHSEPIGWPTLARNGGLALLAAILVWQARTNPGLSIQSVVHDFSAERLFAGSFAFLVLIGIAALFWLVLHLFRQNGRLLLRLEALEANRVLPPRPAAAHPALPSGLPIGSPAMTFDLPDVQGGRTPLEGFLSHGKAAVLIFSDPNCGPCNALLPDIASWQKALAEEVNVVIISHGWHDANRAKASEHGLINVLVETSKRSIAKKYNALGTPTAVAIRQGGTIGSYPVGGADAIRKLFANKGWTEAGFAGFSIAVSQPQPTPVPKPALPLGSAAPSFSLPDLNRQTVDLAALSGEEAVLLLFWNTRCGFCQRMIPQLKDWELARPANAPRLVLVSTGAPEANRDMGLQSTVLIDEKFVVGQVYGANGTPSGLLIDSDGNIASRLAVGAPAVMEMLNGGPADAARSQVALARVS